MLQSNLSSAIAGSLRLSKNEPARTVAIANHALAYTLIASALIFLLLSLSLPTRADAQRAYRLPDGRIMQVYPNGQRRIFTPRQRPVKKRSFFQKLFGGSPKPSPGIVYQPAPPRSYFDTYMPRAKISKPALKTKPARSRGYRTMCVRKCDGYYFPITFSASSRDLNRDAETCANSCSASSALYYYPNRGDVKSMINMDGERYSRLKTAFLYRKKRVESCSCKPKPWSEEAMNVHRTYAEQAAEKKRIKREEKAAAQKAAEEELAEKAKQAAANVGELETEPKPATLQPSSTSRSAPPAPPVDWT